MILVCLCGFLKLQWKASLLRRKGLKDEEQAEQAQTHNHCVSITEEKPVDDVPFGIRALESGMEIDGIWVSRHSTPIPEELKEARREERSSAGSVGSWKESPTLETPEQSLKQLSPKDQASQFSTNHRRSQTEEDLHSAKFWTPGLLNAHNEFVLASRHSRKPSGNDPNQYKPRRSSQLRFSSYGDTQYHEETLSRLEGKATAEILHGEVRQGNRACSLDAVVADNQGSCGSSCKSAGTLSRIRTRTRSSTNSEADRTASAVDIKGKGRAIHSRQDSFDTGTPQSFNEITSIPAVYLPQEDYDPFTTPEKSPAPANMSPISFSRPNCKTSDNSEATRWPLLSDDMPSTLDYSQIRVGQVRANKTVRKVNSGFEVLPAGTFGPYAFFTMKETGSILDEDISVPSVINMNDKKLQKRSKHSEQSSPLHWFRGC